MVNGQSIIHFFFEKEHWFIVKGELEESAFSDKSGGQNTNGTDLNKRKFVRDNSSGNYKHNYIHDTSYITN